MLFTFVALQPDKITITKNNELHEVQLSLLNNSSTSQVQTEHEQTLSTWLLTVEDGGAALLDASRE